MKANEPKSPKSNKAADKALLKEVAAKLSKEHILFKRKVESAKAYLKKAKFPSETITH